MQSIVVQAVNAKIANGKVIIKSIKLMLFFGNGQPIRFYQTKE